jgi:TetR/AcrR family transcriptional repressor of nem operon
LGDSSVTPLERLRGYFEVALGRFASQSCRNGCLVGNLSQEMADQSEAFRARLEQIFDRWVGRFAECIELAQRAGEIPDHLDPLDLSGFWLNGWQGAILRAKTGKSIAPLRTFLNIMFGYVLQAGPTGSNRAQASTVGLS